MDFDAFADAAKSRVGSDQSRQRAFVTVLLLCHLQSKLQKLSTQNYTVFLLPTQPNLCDKFRNFILVIVFWVDFEASAEISSGTPVVIFSPATV
ncbi:MAG: hypothetical protein B7X50_01060 [Alishewanella sp. 34-51-39]|jgi:hypothetical protein|nr:MAG: hypothetical protein B7X50_01060 [Alishewanella sp. 34-51-39]